MTPEQWQRVSELFHEAGERPPDQRAAFLERSCPDEELRREVASLLASADAATSFLDSPAVLPDDPAAEPRRRRVGPYEILREIGHGGMGTVYFGVRSGEFEQKVAVKVARTGLDAAFFLERFRSERQILASLDHPNIVPLLDGGTTDDGLPYFAMSYVDGEPLDRYCTRRALDVPARLRLFRQVCAAVEYAHRHLVVHRDLKPANILVTADGVPRLLDFGIAKLLPSEITAQASSTTAAFRLLTPEYSSPEQVRGAPVTTASDVYSLGVLLYELLAGRRPYRLDSGTVEEVTKAVVEQEPEPPSAARKGLRGDLDNIVLMALRKEPDRRYASVDRLSDDVRRFLEGLPIAARKDTLRYRTGKFVRRHRTAVLAAMLVMLSLVGGMATAAREARRARQEQIRADLARANAESLVDFMLGDLREKLEPTSRLDVLDDVAQKVVAYFDALPPGPRTPAQDARRGRVYRQIAEMRRLQGNVGEAERMTRASLAITDEAVRRAPASAEAQAGAAETQVLLGRVTEDKGDATAALTEFRRARTEREGLVRRRPDDGESVGLLADSWNDEGRVLYSLGRTDEARHCHESARTLLLALPAQAQALTPERTRLSGTLLYLGRLDENAGHFDAATRAYREARDLVETVSKARPSDTEVRHEAAVLSDDLCRATRLDGRYAEAVPECEKSLAILKALVDRDPGNSLWLADLSSAHSFLGRVRERQGDFGAALREFEEDASIMRGLLGREPANGAWKSGMGDALTNVGRAQRGGGSLSEALATHRRALALREELQRAAPDDPTLTADVADDLLEIGRDLAAARQPSAAREAWRHAARELRPILQTSSLSKHRAGYAQALLELGDTDEARPIVARLLEEGYREAVFVAVCRRNAARLDAGARAALDAARP